MAGDALPSFGTARDLPAGIMPLTVQAYCGLDGCYNGGECIQPQVCECVHNYTGKHCEIPPENPASSEVTDDTGVPQQTPVTPDPMTCPDPDFPLVNAEITRSDEQLIVRCKAGHVFDIGGTIAFVHCREGVWDHPKGVFSTEGALVCQAPRCDPPCENGGTCLPEGVCDCPYKYWGSACQRMMCAYPDAKQLSNSSLGGVHSRMKIQCHPRHRMRSGRRWQTILCHQGHWTVSGRGPLTDNDVKCYPCLYHGLP
ncbi:hypothetical protein GWK47_031713 [Chionoecetes opilio]|uniref:EGF-like domain-containing protein n=1 Tax=Chionoecetes opilio TaxID=41210 RepID=A0A8J5D129_CHIOP|nr:hypothetical protein GWK47_031713 [Chionoecetes opilio]